MSRFDRVVREPDGTFQHYFRGQPVRAPGAPELCQNATHEEGQPMWGTVRERRAGDRRAQEMAATALLHGVERLARNGVAAARVQLVHDEAIIEPDHSGALAGVLRQLVPLIDAAGLEFGPSKSDSIAALKRVLASMPPGLVALVRTSQ